MSHMNIYYTWMHLRMSHMNIDYMWMHFRSRALLVITWTWVMSHMRHSEQENYINMSHVTYETQWARELHEHESCHIWDTVSKRITFTWVMSHMRHSEQENYINTSYVTYETQWARELHEHESCHIWDTVSKRITWTWVMSHMRHSEQENYIMGWLRWVGAMNYRSLLQNSISFIGYVLHMNAL